jgi:RND family efflux transporter MFP subunit
VRKPTLFVFGLLLSVSLDSASAQFGPATVRVEPVQRRTVEITQPLVASVEAVTQTTLAAEQPGLVLERTFDEGSRTKKNEVLVRMDVEMLKLERDAAEAGRLALEGALEQAKVRAENSRNEEQRLKGLQDARNAAAGREYRDALTTARIDTTMVAVRTAELAQKRAEVQRLDAQIRKSEVRAPLGDCIVAKRYVEVGQWVKQGDPVADVVQLDPLFVRVNVPEGLVARLKRGDESQVTFDALGGQSFKGKIDQIIPLADPNSRTFPVKILLPNPELKILPGFFGRATITGQGQGQVFIVPRDAIATSGGKHQVIAARGGKAVAVPVTIGQGVGDKVSVTGELTEKDVVVVRGNETLRGGEDLIVQNAPAPSSKTGQGS